MNGFAQGNHGLLLLRVLSWFSCHGSPVMVFLSWLVLSWLLLHGPGIGQPKLTPLLEREPIDTVPLTFVNRMIAESSPWSSRPLY
jgi:hypothetical protein